MGTKNSIEEFEACLLDGLSHLYDPTYRLPDLLYQLTGNLPHQGTGTIRTAIVRAIEALMPPPETPPGARIRRLYELLTYRYIQGLTQTQTAHRLAITVRHLRREQKQAIQLLAQYLLEHQQAPATLEMISPTSQISLPEASPAEAISTAWRSQVRQELASLQQNAPGILAHVETVIEDAVKAGQALATRHGVKVRAEVRRQELLSTIHPAILREVLITAIKKLVEHMTSGEISLQAERQGNSLRIAIAGYPAPVKELPHSDFIQEALSGQGGTLRVQVEEDCLIFGVILPAADKVTVAVVEDNLDLVQFYRNYLSGTRYQLIHVTQTARALETITEALPDALVMDIMLPDINGWELLAQLRARPETRSIPIIICSVVRQAELALAHGATLYLQKPVRRQQFVQALDQVFNQPSTVAPKVAANNPTPY